MLKVIHFTSTQASTCLITVLPPHLEVGFCVFNSQKGNRIGDEKGDDSKSPSDSMASSYLQGIITLTL